ncbi:hypothetical protein PR048_010291 [Dryococelus australis]|uniref:Retroviral polymerase SH3-like domain-containing protein n=1 Tax=Dryococelus australis TaxID=614101 RepID=A0ABQ9I2S4_9NEOP|nr:hypothetical protein PR048_010291 [Dryococelus australis]
MIGYSSSSYRVWDPVTSNAQVSRDVTFDETDVQYEEQENLISKIKFSDGRVKEGEEVVNTEQTPTTAKSDGKFNGSRKGEEVANTNENEEFSPTRPKSKLVKPKHLENYELYVAYCLVSKSDPQTYEEAVEESEDWRKAIKKELEAHNKL